MPIILIVILAFVFDLISPVVSYAANSPSNPTIYYVDIKDGNDNQEGSIKKPFQTLHKAVEVISQRVNDGKLSDKIYLRQGSYKISSIEKELYLLNIKGTSSDFSIISAMPALPNQPDSIQMKSGNWYEKVVIDDGFVIDTSWKRVTENSKIWMTNPGFIKDEWNNSLIKRYTNKNTKITNHDKTPHTTLFTIAPYMLLQDNKPLVWANSINEINKQGMRTYDQKTDTLYVRTFNDTDPNQSLFESWYGGEKQRFRSIFGGNVEFLKISGIEFRLFTRFFWKPRSFKSENERVRQKHVTINDNYFSHGWQHMHTDVGLNNFQGLFIPKTNKLAPHFNDSSNWTVKNNIFYHPSREVFQVHGPDHVFEYNDIIEHGGPWAGPMTYTSPVNTRNTTNAVIRGNFIGSTRNRKPHAGSIFMIELSTEHADNNNECLYGGELFENNIFADLSQGTAIHLGRGSCVMKNITIRNNIFKTNKGGRGTAILITTPHKNLVINNNIFFDQRKAINVINEKSTFKSFGTLSFDSLPSTIMINNNIFSNNIKTINHRLINPTKKSVISITKNLFYKNRFSPSLNNSIYENPKFMDPENLDFRVHNDSVCIQENAHDIGVYDSKQTIDKTLQWWNHKKIEDNSLY